MATALVVAGSILFSATIVGTVASIVSIHSTMRIKRAAVGMAEAAFVVVFLAIAAIMGLVAVSS